MFSEGHIERLIVIVPVKFRPGLWKMHEGAAHTVSSVPGSLTDVKDPAVDMPVSEDDIGEQDAPQDLRDMTSKHDRGPSALQRMQEFFQMYGLARPSDFSAVQMILRATLTVLASADKNQTSFASLKKEHEFI